MRPRNTLLASVRGVPGQCVATEAVSWLTFQHFLWKKKKKNLNVWHACLVITLWRCPVQIGKINRPVQMRGSTSLLSLSCPLSTAALPDHPEAGLEDERCPLMTGCDRAGGQCVCDARHSCLGSFAYPDQETCMKTSKSGKAPSSSSQRKTHTHTHTQEKNPHEGE